MYIRAQSCRNVGRMVPACMFVSECHRAAGTLPENYMQSYQRWPRVGLYDCMHVESVVVTNVQ